MSRSNWHNPQPLWRGPARYRDVSSPNVRPSSINIGSLARLKGFLCGLMNAREWHGFAAAFRRLSVNRDARLE
jgi:hypothetical protein